MACLAKARPRPVRRARYHGSLSVILTAFNEEDRISRRLTELADHVAESGLVGEIILVSDGSTDNTAEIARRVEGSCPIRVVGLEENVGKAAALSIGCGEACHEILVFADTRQWWGPETLELLLENLSDPAVGAASGELIIEIAPGVMAGVGLYWNYEKWLRRSEGIVHSTVGVTGAISAVRRELFDPIPRGTVLDDVYWPLRVVMRGYRVVHDRRPKAFDRLPDRTRDEFRRKVRTLSGNFQLAAILPSAILPWRDPIWMQFLSHKLFRLVVPWALIALLASTAINSSTPARILFWCQVVGYSVGIAGLWEPICSRSRLTSVATSFLILNAAAWVAFWVWISGRSSSSWGKATYASRSSRPRASEEGRS